MDGTRRGLLIGLGGALAASAAAGFAWQGPPGRNAGYAPPGRKVGYAPPGRKVGYAVVGLGGYATGQIMPRLASCESAKLTALVSGTPEKLERYGAEYGIPKTHRYSYANYDSIRDNPDIDVVYVVLPNALHAEYAIRAARAGKHVLCEKPMAVSVAEAEAMVAASRKAGRKLMIGYRSRFEAYNRHAIELVRSGFVGKPRAITAESGFAIRPGQWRLDRPLSGGGSLMDIGIYSLQAARYLSGEEPVAVNAMESTDRSDPRFGTVEDRIDFQLKFPSGLIANCVSSYSSNHNAHRVTGTDGWVWMEPATAYEGQQMWVRKNGKMEPRVLPAPAKNQFVGQLDHFAECVLTDRDPIVPGEEGLRDMRLIEAIYRAAREGRTVRMT